MGRMKKETQYFIAGSEVLTDTLPVDSPEQITLAERQEQF